MKSALFTVALLSAVLISLIQGCGGTAQSANKTNQPPNVSVSVSPTSGPAPLGVTVTVTASDPDGTVTSITIDFGDGSAAVKGPSAQHTYEAAGKFTIQATATDNGGASTSATTTVDVSPHQPPIVSLDLSPASGPAPLTVTAKVTVSDSDATITGTTVNFGDGSAAVSGTSVSHTYKTAGTYTVTATSTDSFGASASATQTIVISSHLPPVVSLDVAPLAGAPPLTVAASVTESDPDGTITSTIIDFGDGSAAVSGTKASHIYTTVDTYVVKATAKDDFGASTSATQTVTVSTHMPPSVSLSVNPTTGTDPLAVTATVTESDSDGTITSTTIDFGDGSAVVNGTTASHTYANVGSYTVKAKATDNFGSSASASVVVTVEAVTAGNTYYIDPDLGSNSCSTYDVLTRTCGSGTDLAYKTPVLFSNAVTPGPGDFIYLRGGTYGTQLIITSSGTASAPITYSNYGTEVPKFTGAPPYPWYDDGSAPFATADVHSDGETLMLNAVSYVVVQGLTISNTRGIGHCHECNHVTIKNSTFLENCTGLITCASPTIQGEESSIGFWGGSHNSLLDNKISGAFDNITIVESDHDLIRGNTSTNGAHTTLSVQCSNYTIVKSNTMSSLWEHLIENLDCEGAFSGQPVIYDDTHHNFFEKNTFKGTPASSNDYAFNAMQWCGQDGVARLNDVYDNLGGGIHIQVYPNECNTVYHNRAYQNTVVANNCWGLLSPSNDTNTKYNAFINNLLYLNTGGSSNVGCSTSDPTQLIIRSPSTAKSIHNLSATSDPGFTNVATHVYTLQAGSAAIDYGTWLTTTTSAGSGTVIPVADAVYFRDSFGIAGEQGDLIQLQGQTQTARIVSIDYSTNTITVNTALTWTSGLGVALAYHGAAPDAGAHEY